MKKILSLILMSFIVIFLAKYVNANSLKFEEHTFNLQTVSGVTHISSNGLVTNDNNLKTNQNINVFELSEDIEVATWSVLKNGKYVRDSLLNIANDFENNNPSYEVIAGVNGDYFDNETINANVIFGNKVLKPSNHQKYQAIEIDNHGFKIGSHDTISVKTELSLSLYDEYNSLIHYENIGNLNMFATTKNQTSIHLNPVGFNPDPLFKYFEINNYVIHNNGSHVYIQGEIGEEVFEFTNNDPIIMSSNELTLNKLYQNPMMKAQKEIRGLNENNLVFGYDGIIIENNTIKTFDEMKGQSHSNNSNRHPRTGFGFNSNGELTLITVDGRNAGGSKGVDLREFAEIMKYYGIKEGYNLDGGGSTQAIFKDNNELKYVNNMSQTPARSVGNGILFVKNKSENKPDIVINDKINIVFNDYTDNFVETIVKLDGKEYVFATDKNIVLDIPKKESVTLSVLVIEDKKGELTRTLIRNELIFTDFKEEVIYPKINIDHKYTNNELEIIITYDDPKRMIHFIRVYLKFPNIDKPALPINSSARVATFKEIDLFEEQEIIVVVSYKDGNKLEKIYEIVKHKETKKQIIYIVIIISILTIVVLFIRLLINKKRLN